MQYEFRSDLLEKRFRQRRLGSSVFSVATSDSKGFNQDSSQRFTRCSKPSIFSLTGDRLLFLLSALILFFYDEVLQVGIDDQDLSGRILFLALRGL